MESAATAKKIAAGMSRNERNSTGLMVFLPVWLAARTFPPLPGPRDVSGHRSPQQRAHVPRSDGRPGEQAFAARSRRESGGDGRPLTCSDVMAASYCAGRRSVRRRYPFSASRLRRVCIVGRPTGRTVRENVSWASATVRGPCSHSRDTISSSPDERRTGLDLRAMCDPIHDECH